MFLLDRNVTYSAWQSYIPDTDMPALGLAFSLSDVSRIVAGLA